MWGKINRNSICFICKLQDEKSGLFMFPKNSLAISNGFKMLEYIYEQEEKNFFPKNFNFMEDAFSFRDREVGFFVRINAYINIVCSLEKIVKKTYEETQNYIKELGYKSILSKNKTAEMEKEIEHFLFWRNKVFAHTAYTSPNKYFYSSKLMKKHGLCEECIKKLKNRNREDIENESTQLTSLAYFGGNYLAYGKKSFQLGGASIQLGEIKSTSFPIIDIAENHFKIIKHFKEWEKIFVEILEEFQRVDRREIIKNNKNILEIKYTNEKT